VGKPDGPVTGAPAPGVATPADADRADPPPPAMPRYDDALRTAGLPRLEARALLEHACGRPREWLVAHGDEPMTADAAERYRELCVRRAAGEPLAYLVGWREFFGQRFAVSPSVLIPRPETEALVEAAIARVPVGGTAIDLGTGSGCIAVSLARARPDLRVTATDASADALALAAENARVLAGGRVRLRLGDWWQAVEPGERFDVALANPPYIAADDPHLLEGDLRHEPRAALTDGGDGLAAYRTLARGAPAHLEPGGWLLLEHGFDQGAAVRALLEEAGLVEVATERDAAGLERVSRGRARIRLR
jgi:release factor glutamine methyltransferase